MKGQWIPPVTDDWRAHVLKGLSEAKGAASLSLVAASVLAMLGVGHGWKQWLSLLGVVAWFLLRKLKLL